MALKFFQIGKANEEIDRLNAELAKVTAERDALTGNDSTIAAEAEKVKGELAAASAKIVQLESDLATARQSISSLKETNLKVESDLHAAQAKLANPEARIKEAAAVQAAEITAKLGQPPVVAAPPANPAQPEKKALKGRERHLAAIKIEGVQ